jgi:hypothetical protein
MSHPRAPAIPVLVLGLQRDGGGHDRQSRQAFGRLVDTAAGLGEGRVARQ